MPTITLSEQPAKKTDICVTCKQEIEETIFMGRSIWNHDENADLIKCDRLGCIGKAEAQGGR